MGHTRGTFRSRPYARERYVRNPARLPSSRLAILLLRSRAGDALDLRRRLAGLFGDLAVLLDEKTVGRLVAVDAAGERARHLAVRALRAVLIDDVEHHEFGVQSGFSRHGRAPVSCLRPPETWPTQKRKCRRQCGAGPCASIGQTDCRLVAADLPLRRSASMSKVSFCPSARPRMPARSTAEM